MKIRYLLALFVFCLFSNVTQSQNLPADFTLETIGYGWNQPVGVVFTPDGTKIFAWEKGGKVYVCKRDGSGNYVKQDVPVLNITEEVGDWRDHGMVGFALDPQFATNGFIYVSYVVDRHYLMNFGTPSYSPTTDDYYSATIGRVTRYHTIVSGNDIITDYSSRKILLGETKETGLPVLYESHGIGGLVFASDGTLLVTGGDGASYLETDSGSLDHTYYLQALANGIIRPQENVGAFRAQMINSLSGKLLRINPSTGDGIPSNPFYSAATPRAPKSRVWALGFRNPFRFTIKPGTGSTNPSTGDIGEIYIGDVQWGLWEELSVINQPGVNCGWPFYEGHTLVEEQFIFDSYSRLYTKNLDEPNPLYGIGGCTLQYLRFRDLFKQATADHNKTVYNPCNPAVAIGTGNRYVHHRPVLDWSHHDNVARVPIFNGNNAEVALVGSAESGATGSPFRGNASVVGCWYTGTLFPVQYRNTFLQSDYGGTNPEGSWIRSISVEYTDVVKKVQNLASGFGAVVSIAQNPLDGTIVVVDIGDNNIKEIGYGGNYLPIVKMSSNKTYGPTTLSVNFTGSNSIDNDGSIVSYLWDFGDNTPTSISPNPSHNFTAPANTPKKFVVKLKVTDNRGGSSTDSMIISVNNTPPVINITSPIKNSTYSIGVDTSYTCAATVVDAEQGPAQLKYQWQTFLRHNNHQHAEKIDENVSPLTRISRIGCNGDDYYWLIRLTVTDAAGLSATDSSKIFPHCPNQVALPLLLRAFSVTQDGNDNMVKWTTELEENIDHFEIERCQDGVSFSTVYSEKARNLTSVSTYSFNDNSFSTGANYYRLKIVESDGTIRYSMIIKTNSENIRTTKLMIAPNPVTDVFSISYDAAIRGMATIQIRDVNGRELTTVRQIVNEGKNVIYINTKLSWPAGTYFVVFTKGDETIRSKFVLAK